MEMMENQLAVLYVEDDPASRRLMSMLLQGRMKVSHLTILEDSENFPAIVEALDPKPDIILLDIHVKPYNGFKMLEILRRLEWGKDKPIVALTASVMNEEVQQLKHAGFNGCLAKPIDIEAFPRLIHRIAAGETIWSIFS